ncbi:hypothetical protein QWY85_19305 [Neolewinella lacunae]|uniref:Uncharacterized protein n=1 Tax=Neolewinella lacunae TaxID=1517758 RepID=A0A923T9Z4_9BACT|nr:hypothetical protein [Neolewinella lacunae]MBC6996054.1 hypothetical protein [Neolewinella lacunae]MDN3636826.1 hypothetical protein [Neolewinella lacunae]
MKTSLVHQKENLFGCFVSGPSLLGDATKHEDEAAEEKGKSFRRYIWGDIGIDHLLKQVVNIEYGNDVKLILFQFYLNPLQYELDHLDKGEGFRKREKSIGKNIIVTDENFFEKTEGERLEFLEASILNSLIQLEEEHKGKLDTRFDLLIREVKKLFNFSEN